MSWSLSTGPVAKADFDAAVDAAEASPTPTDEADIALVAAAKESIKALAAATVGTLTDDLLAASASGHGDGYGYVSVSVNGAPSPIAKTATTDDEGATEGAADDSAS